MAQAAAQIDTSQTVLGALVAAIRSAAAFDRNDQVPPAAVLWPDEERAWLELLPRLRAALPELLTLGPYESATKTGPAIWIKAMLGKDEDGARLLPAADWPDDAVPIVYLPGLGRQHIRAIDECPRALQPLCELQFRGTLWTQINAKDWTPRAFLQSADGGLGLSLATDVATLGAMRQALEKLCDVPVARLQGRTLDAGDFHELLAPDPARTVLDWMSDRAGYKARAGGSWAAFRTVCMDKFGFDPDKTDVTKAGQLLADRQGPWSGIWNRFEENPGLYPGVREVLRRSKPTGPSSLFDAVVSVYPQDNEVGENALRQALSAVGGLSEAAARTRIAELETEHAPRRSLVWAKLDEAPLAAALTHLAELARLSASSLGGADRDQAASLYCETGWRVDDAAIAALAAMKSAADCNAVGAAVAAVYRPWLEKSAECFQKLVATEPLASSQESESIAASPGTCVVFADGLRMDLGQRLAAELQRRGFGVSVDWRWSTVPTVTSTAKPAASPVTRSFDSASQSDDFVPQIAADGKNLTADRFRNLLRNAGFLLLSAGDTGDGNKDAASGWLEVGTIDKRGHSEGVRLASMLGDEIRLIADRVTDLFNAGWKRAQVITDHGWLLLPGGLPKVTLPRFVTETNWRRCASVKAGASPDCQQHGWHWNPTVSIALAPGIACFRDGAEYAHGGLSVQEAVTPVITVTASGSGAASGVAVESLVWNQLTGRVQVSGSEGVSVDLRRDAADAGTTLLDSDKPRPIDAKGQAKIYAKDEAEGLDAEVVVLDGGANVIARRRTRVGAE